MDVLAAQGAPGLFAGPADRPLLTFYDDATGERTELSAARLGRWAERTARLLDEGCELATGDRAAVLLPPHWQTAVVLLGAWSAGLAVSYRSARTAGLPEVGAGAAEPYDAVFVARHRLADWLDHVPAARHRFRLDLAPDVPGRPAPDGYRDFLAELDRYPGPGGGGPLVRDEAAASVDGTTFREWGSLAAAIAEQQDLRRGDRVLMDAAERDHPVFWLLAPLFAGASVVLCANLQPAELPGRIAAEGVTRIV
ncbi:TIGR03089 family protein [Plantactinospora siamensis]|uniref:TIGR03089 family protein n=1 Tax=Plantactinospora siamensis TaxID=555372 RepID=A0ABV6NZC4_9ACTN